MVLRRNWAWVRCINSQRPMRSGCRAPGDQDFRALGAGFGAAGGKCRSRSASGRFAGLAARRGGADAVLQENLLQPQNGVQPSAHGAGRQRYGRRLLGGLERLPADEHNRSDHALPAAGDVRRCRRRPRGCIGRNTSFGRVMHAAPAPPTSVRPGMVASAYSML
jgi:hypothetical protein